VSEIRAKQFCARYVQNVQNGDWLQYPSGTDGKTAGEISVRKFGMFQKVVDTFMSNALIK